MSWQANAWANGLPYDVCKALAYRVLTKLTDVADERGQRAWRSKSQLADELGVSQRSIQRAIKELENDRLIIRGDQRYVQHLRADKRPTVYDCNLRHSGVTTAAIALWSGETTAVASGETELSTGETTAVASGETELSTGETTAVASGETTAVARTTHRTTTTQVPEVTTDRTRSICPRIRAGRDHLTDSDRVCFACGERVA